MSKREFASCKLGPAIYRKAMNVAGQWRIPAQWDPVSFSAICLIWSPFWHISAKQKVLLGLACLYFEKPQYVGKTLSWDPSNLASLIDQGKTVEDLAL